MNKFNLFKPPHGEENQHAYHTKLEHKVDKLLTPFQEYIQNQTTASILLLICTVIALIWASIPTLNHWYHNFVNIPIGLYIANYHFSMPLQHWVNNVLLTLFFFFVGLEIKREFLVGELANNKRAVFIIFAAIGGMVVPVFIYYLINWNTDTSIGWGIPMATDTAFALGVLACFKNKLPKGIFTFVAALAIIDDIGAILIIAIFYTSGLNTILLGPTLLLVSLLALMNYAGIRKPIPYILIGILVWILIEHIGIHGTVSGVLIAFLIPARPEQGPRQFIIKARKLLNIFEKQKAETPLVLEDSRQHSILEEVQEVAKNATTPLQRWESKLELPIAILVLPLFALVNAGIAFDFELLIKAFTQPVSLGIILGLVIGKPLGIWILSQLAITCKLGELPKNTTFHHISCAALLMGIGFTMSLFIANVSFTTDESILVLAKAGILLASLISAIVGIIFLSKISFSNK